MKHHLKEYEIERQAVIFDSDSGCCTEDEVGSTHNNGFEEEDIEELVQPTTPGIIATATTIIGTTTVAW
jgi:hypothetical protein